MTISSDIFEIITATRLPSRQEQERRWAIEAVEAMAGERAVALATAPRRPELTPEEVDEMYAEGRFHRQAPVNPHDE